MAPIRTVSISIFPDEEGRASRNFVGVPWYPGLTVLQALIMADALREEPLLFRVVYGSPEGAFIDQIDGVADSDTHHWMLYVDGRLSEVGVGEAILRPATPTLKVEFRYQRPPAEHQ
jgi:hypothetical protein